MAVTRNTNGLPVQPLISDTPGAIPTAAELNDAEISINTVDKKLHGKNVAGALYTLDFGVEINDTLTSTATDQALSAAQGKALNDLIMGLGTIFDAADLTDRDAKLASGEVGFLDVVHVEDDGDGQWARYQNLGTSAAPILVKVSDQDALSAGLGATNLSYTASPTGGTVGNTSGSDAAIPLATEVNAGQMLPSTGVVGDMVFATATGFEVATPQAAGTF